MYNAFLAIHSLLRWVVLLAAVFAVARSIAGWSSRRSWTPTDERVSAWFTNSLNIQFLLGVFIFVALSPFAIPALRDWAGTMQNAALRFITVEHQVGMLIAIALAHIGRARIRKATDDVKRHRLAAIFFGISLVVILMSIPWPSMPGGRPLFRGFTSSVEP
jgi:hypothetical protein